MIRCASTAHPASAFAQSLLYALDTLRWIATHLVIPDSHHHPAGIGQLRIDSASPENVGLGRFGNYLTRGEAAKWLRLPRLTVEISPRSATGGQS